jgi:hypothetical protein
VFDDVVVDDDSVMMIMIKPAVLSRSSREPYNLLCTLSSCEDPQGASVDDLATRGEGAEQIAGFPVRPG